MYNLIVTYEEGVWDGRPFTIESNRVGEYTDNDLVARYSSLDPAVIGELRSAPTLFAYERDKGDARVGFLRRVGVRSGQVRLEYDICPELPPIPASRLNALARGLDIEKYEMNRTHWAIKAVDLIHVLMKAGAITEEQVKRLSRQSDGSQGCPGRVADGENCVGPEIAGALALFWAGGLGPSNSSLHSAFSVAGYQDDGAGTKQDRVRRAVSESDKDTARRVAEELVALLRGEGRFRQVTDEVARLRSAFERRGSSLSEDGYIAWGETSAAIDRPRLHEESVTSSSSESRRAPLVFISYSHDSEAHKRWVRKLASDLRDRGINAILDQWNLAPGQDIAAFMEQMVTLSNRVLLVCTERYVEKANRGHGGVGYERLIVSAELVVRIDTNKFIPIVRQTVTPRILPTYLGARLYIDFSADAEYEQRIEEMAREIHGARRALTQPIGPNPYVSDTSAARSSPPDPGVELRPELTTRFWESRRDSSMRISEGGPGFSLSLTPTGTQVFEIDTANSTVINIVQDSPLSSDGRGQLRPNPCATGLELPPTRIPGQWLRIDRSGHLDFWADLVKAMTVRNEQQGDQTLRTLHPQRLLNWTVWLCSLCEQLYRAVGYAGPVQVRLFMWNAKGLGLPGAPNRFDRHVLFSQEDSLEIGPIRFPDNDCKMVAQKTVERLWQAFGHEMYPNATAERL